MGFVDAGTTLLRSCEERMRDCLAQHGSFAHSYATGDQLLRGPKSNRNLSDAVIFLCNLHGRTPGVVAHAAARATDRATRLWLEDVLELFAPERNLVARLSVEAGGAPSPFGATRAEATLLAQRHTLDMLAQSERNGCGLGAALALIADWSTIRFILNTAAGRFRLPVPPCRLPEERSIIDAAGELATSAAMERAMLFGAEQLLLQHKGLWDVLEARAHARS